MAKRLCAVLLATCLFCACAALASSGFYNRYDTKPAASRSREWQARLDGFCLYEGDANRLGVWQPKLPFEGQHSSYQCVYGSAGLIGWSSILISVYLDERDGEKWNDAAIEENRHKLAIAVDWIQNACAAYCAAPHIYFDDGTQDSDLFFHQEYPARFVGGTDNDESEAYYVAIEDLCAQLDTEALHNRYGTSSVGFLFFLPVAGVSFTVVHYLEDTNDFYHEYSTLYRYDAYSDRNEPETPTVFAHEILHLFGAADLYEGSADTFVTQQLTDFVKQTWPDDIMLSTYEANGETRQNTVTKSLCPLSAYRLGLIPHFEQQEEYPDVASVPPGAFSESPDKAALYPFDSGAIAV